MNAALCLFVLFANFAGRDFHISIREQAKSDFAEAAGESGSGKMKPLCVSERFFSAFPAQFIFSEPVRFI